VYPEMPGLADLAFGGRPPRVASDSGLVGGGRVLVPGLADLGLGGWSPGGLPAGGRIGGLGVGDGGHAGQVGGRQ